jgi:D-glycero-alpha-D-manno-heptose 1-phosphate guanylyltransferase
VAQREPVADEGVGCQVSDTESKSLAAVVLAGGMGTRLRSVVADRPKVLAPVAGRPFLTYLLDQIAAAGIKCAVLSTGYMAEQFASVIGDRYRDLEIVYAHEQTALGTGGAIKFAGSFADADELLVMNGDSYCEADLCTYFDWHRQGRHDVSLMLVKVDDASRYGTVELGSDGRITAFREKRPEGGPGYINAGVYLLRREMLEQIPGGPTSIERDLFPRWLTQYKVMGWVTDGAFIDIGIPSDYERSHEFMKHRLTLPPAEGRGEGKSERHKTRSPYPLPRGEGSRRRIPPTVFLDRDGTINREVHHLSDPDQLELLPGAAVGLRKLCNAGCPLIIVSNQSPIGRGMFTEDRLREINSRLAEMLASEGIQIAGWYWCPHAPWEGCDCRKPAPGMFYKARDEMGVILKDSWVVGDRIADLCAGRQVGARTILVATGYGETEYNLPERPANADYFVPTLHEAADIILGQPTEKGGWGRAAGEPPAH